MGEGRATARGISRLQRRTNCLRNLPRRQGVMPELRRRVLLPSHLILSLDAPPALRGISIRKRAPASHTLPQLSKSFLHQNVSPRSATQSATFPWSLHTEPKSPESPPNPPSPCKHRRGTSPTDHQLSHPV